MVQGWVGEALIETFVDGLKPWIAKEIKLRQMTQLQEVMIMIEVLEENHAIERNPIKDMKRKFYKTLQTKVSQNGRDTTAATSKSKHVIKKPLREEVQEKIKKGLCFMCGRGG